MGKNNYHELISFDALFDDGQRTFYIPDYQRGYSWEIRQCRDIIEDLERILNEKTIKNYTHFMGTIVAFPSNKNNPHTFEVVDGQQRLTTLILLMCVLYFKLDNSHKLKKEIYQKFLIRTANTAPKAILRLGAIGQQNDIFFHFLKNGKIKNTIKRRAWIKSDHILCDAFEYFSKYINESDHSAESIINTIRQNLGFILYKPSSSLETSIMFEVINNRGKPLSELEKVKNWIHYKFHKVHDYEQLNHFQACWRVILENLNKAGIIHNDEENSFLRYCWIAYENPDKNKSHHVYDNLKSNDEYDLPKIIDFIDFLEKASFLYVTIKSASSYSNDIERHLQRIKYQSSRMAIMPLIIAIWCNTDIHDRVKSDILNLLEILNFRYYCSGIRKQSNSEQARFYNLANNFCKKFGQNGFNSIEELVTYDADWLLNELKNFINENANDKHFITSLTNPDRDYGEWGDLKFFLANYECWLNDYNNDQKNLSDYMFAPIDKKQGTVKNNNLYHKEHIWAKACDAHLTSENARAVKLRESRRLGNFILLNAGSNGSNSKDPIEEKVTQYTTGNEGKNFDNSLSVKAIINNFDNVVKANERQFNEWRSPYYIKIYQEFINKNEDDLIKFALDRWPAFSDK